MLIPSPRTPRPLHSSSALSFASLGTCSLTAPSCVPGMCCSISSPEPLLHLACPLVTALFPQLSQCQPSERRDLYFSNLTNLQLTMPITFGKWLWGNEESSQLQNVIPGSSFPPAPSSVAYHPLSNGHGPNRTRLACEHDCVSQTILHLYKQSLCSPGPVRYTVPRSREKSQNQGSGVPNRSGACGRG